MIISFAPQYRSELNLLAQEKNFIENNKFLNVFTNLSDTLDTQQFTVIMRKIKKEFLPSLEKHTPSEKELEILEKLMKALCYQLFSAECREIRGMLHGILVAFFKNEKTPRQSIEQILQDVLKNLLLSIKQINLQTIDLVQEEHIHTALNKICIVGEFVFSVGIDENYAYEPLNEFCLFINQSMSKVIEDLKISQVTRSKFLDIIIDGIKACYSLLVINAKHPTKLNIEELYKFAKFSLSIYDIHDRIIKEVLQQTALLYTRVLFLTVPENSNPEQFATDLLEDMRQHPPIVLNYFVGSVIILKDNLNLNQVTCRLENNGPSLSILELLDNFSRINDNNIRIVTFRNLTSYLDKVMCSPSLKAKFCEGKDYRLSLDMILSYWSYPLRGLTYWVDYAFTNLLKTIKEEKKLITLLSEELLNIQGRGEQKKKYKALSFVMEYVEIQEFIKKNTGLLKEVMRIDQVENDGVDAILIDKMLLKLYTTLKKEDPNNYLKTWTNYWKDIYLESLQESTKEMARWIIKRVNPIFVGIDQKSVAIILPELQNKVSVSSNYVWSYVNLLQIARNKGFLCQNSSGTGYSLLGSFEIELSFLEELIVTANRHIALDVLKIVCEPLKVGERPAIFEYQLILRFLRFYLRHSYPDMRQDTSVTFKKFFMRVREIFEDELNCNDFDNLMKVQIPSSTEMGKKGNEIVGNPKSRDQKIKHFKNFVWFVNELINEYLKTIYPEAAYEVSLPMHEIIKLLYLTFGGSGYSPSRKKTYKGVPFLKNINAYRREVLMVLLNNVHSPWDTVRCVAFDIILLFPHEVSDSITKSEVLLTFETAINFCKNAVIKNYDAGGLVISLCILKFSDLIVEKFPKKELQIMEYVLDEFVKNFTQMQKLLAEGSQNFASYYVHGFLTVFSTALSKCDRIFDLYHREKTEFLKVFEKMINVIIQIVEVTARLSCESIASWLINNTEGGDAKNKENILSNIEKLLGGNILIESLEEQMADAMPSDNSLVIGFYLIGRESGIFFEKFAYLCSYFEDRQEKVISDDLLEKLVQTFFDFLLSTKHPASIDKISNGLTIMCRELGRSQNVKLIKTAERLIDFLLNTLENNSYQSTIRRSGGIPHALIALIRADSIKNKMNFLQSVLQRLFFLVNNGKTVEVKVHSYNILKFIFQDSHLSLQLQPFFGDTMALAIIGFASDEWSIRNSSLMLFAMVAKRMITSKADSSLNASSLHIIEFFRRAPKLLPLFIQEIKGFLEREEAQQYPTLYPIALILSKLDPYEILPEEEEEEENKIKDLEESKSKEQSDSINTKKEEIFSLNNEKIVVSSKDLNLFLGLLMECSTNRNFLGRVMTARAIIPFVSENVLLDIIDKLCSFDLLTLKKNHNRSHGNLLMIYELVKRYTKRRKQCLLIGESNHLKILENILEKLYTKIFIITSVKCSPIVSIYMKILKKFIKFNHHEPVSKSLSSIKMVVETQLTELITSNTFAKRPKQDYGQGLAIADMMSFIVKFKMSSNLIQQLLEYIQNNFEELIKGDFSQIRSFLNSLANNHKMYQRDCALILKHTFLIAQLIIEKHHDLLAYIGDVLRVVNKFAAYDEEEFIKKHFIDLMGFLEKLFNLNPDATDNLKSLVKNSGLYYCICHKIKKELLDTFYEKKFVDTIAYYSQPDQKDYMRLACVKALKSTIRFYLIENERPLNYVVQIVSSIYKLIVDEEPEIRKQICKIIKTLLFNVGSPLSYNDNYTLEIFSEKIISIFQARIHHDTENSVATFLVKEICCNSNYKYKLDAHWSQKIFTLDRPNKYVDDIVFKRIFVKQLDKLNFDKELLDKIWKQEQDKHQIKVSKELLEFSLNGRGWELFYYNEYIFEQELNNSCKKLLVKDALNHFDEIILKRYQFTN